MIAMHRAVDRRGNFRCPKTICGHRSICYGEKTHDKVLPHEKMPHSCYPRRSKVHLSALALEGKVAQCRGGHSTVVAFALCNPAAPGSNLGIPKKVFFRFLLDVAELIDSIRTVQ